MAMIMISGMDAAESPYVKLLSRLIRVPIKSVQTKTLIGEGGNNALIGEGGRVQSQVSSKTLIGEGGKNTLIGEGGKNTLIGEGGKAMSK